MAQPIYLGSYFDKDALIEELLQLDLNLIIHRKHLDEKKRWAEGLPIGVRSQWRPFLRDISSYIMFIGEVDWFISTGTRPGGISPVDLLKLKRYTENMVTRGALRPSALDVLS